MAWQLDPSHSEIQFAAKHLMISTVRGRFHKFTATVDGDEQNDDQQANGSIGHRP